MISEQEFELLRLLNTTPKIPPTYFKSEAEFKQACDMALTLLQKGYLFTAKPSYFEQDDEPIKFDCLAARFSLTVKSIDIVAQHQHYGDYVKYLPEYSPWNIASYFIIALMVITSFTFILMV